METNKRLRETVDRAREELRTTRAQAERSQQEAERCGCSSVGVSHLLKTKGPLSANTHALFSVWSCMCTCVYLQAAGGPSSEVVGGETQAAGARSWAAAEILSGQRETAEGSSGSEEGSAQPNNICTFSCTIPFLKYCTILYTFCHSLQNRAFKKR